MTKQITLTGILSLKPKGKGLQSRHAFTLVELIVVITIIAILGTIAFISLQGYSKSARDSVRISDMSKIKTTLELFQLNAGKYPIVTDGTVITYTGLDAWTQGTFGEATFNNVEKLDKIPTDPLTGKEYTYSTTSTRQEFQIAGIMEGDEVSFLSNQANAAEKTATLKITGNYNGKVLKVSTGSTTYVLAVPSIITSSGAILEEIVTNKLLAYNGYKNLPSQYEGSSYNVLGDSGITLINNADLLVFTGDIKTLSDTTQTGIDARADLITNLQNAYTGTTIASIGEIAQIINTSGSDAIELLSSTIVSNNLGGSVATSDGGGGGGGEPITDWRSIDTNCDIPDIVIGTQTWAGCNSTLGNGIERGKLSNGTDGEVYTCYHNYDGGDYDPAFCPMGDISMASNTKANTWFTGTDPNGDTELDNIWGKFYLWNESAMGKTDLSGNILIEDDDTICPEGYHVPSDTEWEYVEEYLFDGTEDLTGCRTANDYQCVGIGWDGHTGKNNTNNLVEALQLPLSGVFNFNGTSASRGSNVIMWTSTAHSSTYSYSRVFTNSITSVRKYYYINTFGFNVRCIKD